MGKANQQNAHKFNPLLQSFHEPSISSQQASSQLQLQTARLQQGYAAGASDPPGVAHDQSTISQMSAMDRFGLPGLLATVRSENPDVASLAIGQDLTQLGLNVNSPE